MLVKMNHTVSTSTNKLKLMLLVACSVLVLFFAVFSIQGRAETYKTNDVFLSENFANNVPAVKVVWIRDALKEQVGAILAHPYAKLRVKYWMSGNKSAWILEEIGKERPITAGIIINNGKIEKVEILAFRESRGWEVKYPFFLKQFIQSGLKADHRLDQNIDGITGATLSVRAVTKLSRMALLLHKHQTEKEKS
jgi:hypothetical protein